MLVIPLLGVVNDGRKFSGSVPQYNAQQVDVPAGVSCTLNVEVVYPDGSPAAIEGAYILTVKRTPFALTVPLGFIKSGTRAGNVVSFTFGPTDTAGMAPRRYIYDVWVTADGDRTNLIPVSSLVLLPVSSRPT